MINKTLICFSDTDREPFQFYDVSFCDDLPYCKEMYAVEQSARYFIDSAESMLFSFDWCMNHIVWPDYFLSRNFQCSMEVTQEVEKVKSTQDRLMKAYEWAVDDSSIQIFGGESRWRNSNFPLAVKIIT